MNTTTDVTPASSPATSTNTPTLEIPRGAEYDKWRMTGHRAEATPQEESAPSKESSAAATTDKTEVEPEEKQVESASAPEAGKKQDAKKTEPRSDAGSRIKELLAKTKKLEMELAEAKKPREKTETAASSPATVEPVKVEAVKALDAPKKPKLEDFKTWDEYEEAKDKYYEDLAQFSSQKSIADYKQKIAQEALQKENAERLAGARKKYADFDTVVKPLFDQIVPRQGPDGKLIHQIDPVVAQIIDRSPVMVDLLYVIGGNAEGMADFVQTAKTDPISALRKAFLVERLVMEELEKQQASKEPAEKEQTPSVASQRDDSGKLTARPEKKVTTAPPIGSEVSSRVAPPSDQIAEAVKKVNPAEYIRLANDRDLKRRKG